MSGKVERGRVRRRRAATTRTSPCRSARRPSCSSRRRSPTRSRPFASSRERLLLATAFALVLALVLGLTAAGMLAHRLLRLETAAERIAGGDFGAPIVDHGNDEIGELARRVRPDARAARAARQRAQGVRRERVARAANAAVLDRRVPRAARGRGARRGDAPRLHRDDAGAGAAAGEALDRPPRPLARRRRPADASCASRSISATSSQHARRRARAPRGVDAGTCSRRTIDDDVWCLGDDARILQIGRALATNAMTHTPAGTTRDARERGGARDRAELVVEDDGPGIPDEPARSGVRALLPGRGWDGVGERARPRDRAASSRGSWAATCGSSPRRARRVFTLDLPGEPVPGRTAQPQRFHVKTRRESARARPSVG